MHPARCGTPPPREAMTAVGAPAAADGSGGRAPSATRRTRRPRSSAVPREPVPRGCGAPPRAGHPRAQPARPASSPSRRAPAGDGAHPADAPHPRRPGSLLGTGRAHLTPRLRARCSCPSGPAASVLLRPVGGRAARRGPMSALQVEHELTGFVHPSSSVPVAPVPGQAQTARHRLRRRHVDPPPGTTRGEGAHVTIRCRDLHAPLVHEKRHPVHRPVAPDPQAPPPELPRGPLLPRSSGYRHRVEVTIGVTEQRNRHRRTVTAEPSPQTAQDR